jgi:hypothetical protein
VGHTVPFEFTKYDSPCLILSLNCPANMLH